MNHQDREEHILVCLSSSPSNAKIIQEASKMALAFNAAFTAVYVETPGTPTAENKKRLEENTRLAQKLGATIETIFGDDIAFQIIEFSRLSHVTKIVVGRSVISNRNLFTKKSLVDKLIDQAGDLDVYIIPDAAENLKEQIIRDKKREIFFNSRDFFKTIIVLLVSTIICAILFQFGLSESNVIPVYILGVLIISLITTKQIYSIASSVISILMFNYFFVEPRFSLEEYENGYPVTIVLMLMAAFITSTLSTRIHEFTQNSTQTAFRTKILFDTNQLLQMADSSQEIIEVLSNQIQKLLSRDVVVYIKKDGFTTPYVFVYRDNDDSTYKTEYEKQVALWVSKNNKKAGATTERFSDSKCLYHAIRVNDEVFGVVGIPMEKNIDPFENSILLSILGEGALAMENYQNAKEKEESMIMAENERLRANMLRSISHDLRTPLTSISGNASNLISNGSYFDDETKNQIYTDIYDDSLWLINLVENLLSITRIEDGKMHLKLQAELLDEIVEEALRHVSRRKVEHDIKVTSTNDILLVECDPRLIVQVFINIIDNAIKYTPKDSHIEIVLSKEEDHVKVQIKDDGDGIEEDMKDHVFEMFYTGANKIVDSRKSLGLGLALCKSIINAHNGEISVENNVPHGTIFTFTLPSREVCING